MIKRVIKKQTKKALSFGEKAVLILALVAVTAVVSKAEETKTIEQLKAEQKAKLREQNQKAIDKLVETAPTDKELIGNVSLVKRSHRVEEPFSCSVALADRAEMQRQLGHSGELSKERRKEYYSTLQTVTQLIRKNKCGEGK